MYPAAKVFADDVSLYSRTGPGLAFKSFRVSGETGPVNGKLDPGETADIIIVLRNAGTSSPAVSARLVSPDPRLTVLDGSGSFGPAAEADTTASTADWFRVSASADAPVEVPLDCRLMLSSGGYADTLRIPVIVGDSMNLPNGPDEYGYCIFDHTDSCYPQRPDYDWLELRGPGTRLLLGGDETKTVPLPSGFGTWRYYGVDHDSISICSNGWVAPGTSERVDFVNVQLPYEGAPPNIVALCWDDLDPADYGRVWYYWDSTGHRFIVEYDSVPYFGHRQHWEKVQLHVYDRTVPTPTGDNSMMVHFRTANDFSQATVGFQNRDGTIGLTHEWNNWYPRVSATLRAREAVRFETVTPTGVAEAVAEPQMRSRLWCEPTVMRHSTWIRLSPSLPCRLAVYAQDGSRVAELGPGPEWRWDGRNARGARVAAGVYFVHTTSGRGAPPARVVVSR